MIPIFRRYLQIFLLIALLPLPLHARGAGEDAAGDEGAHSAGQQLDAEYSKAWKVGVLPFISDDSDVLRSIPLAKSLPEAIVEALAYIRFRTLSASEREGYSNVVREALQERDEEGNIIGLPEILPPERRELEVENITGLSTSYYRNYARGLRAYLAGEGTFHPRLLEDMSRQSDVDLFIGGHVQIQDGYAFVDIVIFSPYIPSPASAVLASRLFSIRSIEALDSIKQYISREIGGDLYNAPFASMEISLPKVRTDGISAEPAVSSETDVAPETGDAPRIGGEAESGTAPRIEGEAETGTGSESAEPATAALSENTPEGGPPQPPETNTGENPSMDRYRVYIDGEYRGTAPALLSVLEPGLRRVQIYLADRMVVDRKVQLNGGETAGITLPPPREPQGRLALHTVPAGLQVFDGSSRLGVTPLLLDLEQETRYLQIRGEEIQNSYLLLEPDVGRMLKLRLPPDSVDWKLQMQRDRRQFYGALGMTLISGITSLISQGVNLNLSAADFLSWPAEEQDIHRVKIYSARTVTFTALSIAVLSSVHSIDQLIQYLQTAEQARGVLDY